MNILNINGVSKHYNIESGIFRRRTGVLRALDNVSMTLTKGKVTGIVGESGSGKTTLGKIACRLLKPDSGTVEIENKSIDLYSRIELAEKIQMIFQDPFASLNPKLSIETILNESVGFFPVAERQDRVFSVLKSTGLDENILKSYPHQFSGGQRQRIAIARALLREPQIIIADEPLSSLDISIANQLLNLFMKLKETYSLSLIFISHDLVTASNLSDHLIVMKDGQIVEEGETDKIISNSDNEYTRRLISAVPNMDN